MGEKIITPTFSEDSFEIDDSFFTFYFFNFFNLLLLLFYHRIGSLYFEDMFRLYFTNLMIFMLENTFYKDVL
jgi:hypothetical protein